MPVSPTEQAAINHLAFAKQSAHEQLIQYLNGLTTNAMSRYPAAEVASWPYQKTEAEAIIAAGNGATLAMAPFITGVCVFHKGAASNAQRLAQVKEKAAAIKANADAWATAAQFVNGLRARTKDEIDAATDPIVVSTVIASAKAEAEAFRTAAGL